ncbi:MAG: hypothetical protein CVU39_21655 [Chloroflexi bacterium HGW-Chloroflexi-10]|nr:MAG: hypothetical protein CVU39_21655 [Chloroflexi bacterium HGW-Chloroflexi-10]
MADFSSHPIFLFSTEDLPPVLRGMANEALPAEQTCQGIMLVPADVYPRSLSRRVNPQQALIFTEAGVLQVAGPGKKGQPAKTQWIPVDQILKLRLSMILLYGRVEIWGVLRSNGQVVKIDLEYNTVGQPLLKPMLHALIRKSWNEKGNLAKTHPVDETYSNFVNQSFSFYNALNSVALQLDERVLGIVYQPEITEPYLKFFRRAIFPQSVVVMTDRQLILLQEDVSFKPHHEWIFTFCAWHWIEDIQQNDCQNWQQLTISLSSSSARENIVFVMEANNAEKLNALWQAVRGKGETTLVTAEWV